MSGLKLRGVRKSFGAVEVIKGIDLDIDDKEFVVFVGPSGCGKSTLLRMIAGLETITGGEHRHRRPARQRPRPSPSAALRWCSSPTRSIRT